MKRNLLLLAPSFALLLAGTILSPASSSHENARNDKTVRTFLQNYCSSCHTGKSPAAGRNLEALLQRGIATNPDTWRKVSRYVKERRMPPAAAPQPPDDLRANAVAEIDAANPTSRSRGIVVRRLNRVEYRNTVRDLLGIDYKGVEDFPTDNVGYGFDNIADLLTLSPLLFEKYLSAAEAVAEQAIVIPGGEASEIDLGSFKYPENKFAAYRGDNITMFSNGIFEASQTFARGARYRLTLRVFGDQAGDQPPKLVVLFDGKPLKELQVSASSDAKAAVESIDLSATVGRHVIGLAFTNDFYQPENPNLSARDRNIHIAAVKIDGPILQGAELPNAHRLLIPDHPASGKEVAAASKSLRAFATRAYRKPVTQEEADRLASLVAKSIKEGESYERGMQVAVTAVLVSPNFLLRVDRSSGDKDAGYELASRLSYFLWSSMPDAELIAAASSGKLSDSETLSREIERMLKNPKAGMLAENFASQWLTLRRLDGMSLDRAMFRDFEKVKEDMKRETTEFFANVVRSDTPVTDFLDAKYTFINQRLAKLYGISGVEGESFRKVSLEGTPRAGLMTQASILAVTSNPTRTSPVKRGKWILDEILGEPVPPPPPGVGVIKEDAEAAKLATLRQRLEEHRNNPACAGCHNQMDPLGFALENYDAMGRWRVKDGDHPIDASGKLPSGEEFNGAAELSQLLMKKKDRFVRSLTEKLMIYALGRGLTESDDSCVERIVREAKKSQLRFSSLVKGIVLSSQFRMNAR